jgi:pyrrolidone-carboxylate peptidase
MQTAIHAVIGDTKVEEARLTAALAQIPEQVNAFHLYLESLSRMLEDVPTFEGALQLCYDHGLALWRAAAQEIQRSATKDDRPLYWGRLQMLQCVRQQRFAFEPEQEQRRMLLAALEAASRGRTSAHFTQAHSKRILVTGFDPFGFSTPPENNTAGANSLVDLAVTNPSGAAALELSNTTIFHDGRLAEVQTAIFPVRYEDFDLGIVEDFFRPYFAEAGVDMIITISRGRTEFDLERFTGRRRSALRGDNVNRSILDDTPVSALPLYQNIELISPEFLESTLPIASLQAIQSYYRVNDNRRVAYLNEGREPETIEARNLAELAERIAHVGSGGGFLSNEISYRTHWLREQLGVSLAVGHLHVPKPDLAPDGTTSSDPQSAQAMIVAQVKEIIKAALVSL